MWIPASLLFKKEVPNRGGADGWDGLDALEYVVYNGDSLGLRQPSLLAYAGTWQTG
jgi:hypothetical protein